ncbi:hypothetical protein PPERSA_04965 [Pseudocohnilembus persalinus]|uniref:tRNA-dihydrouridine(16/17) synthase [NAD(P)(+)] n=1 Tax=Pseudocohnilembus persalinus TaxID=266149 RepID=A0A0V0QWF6_PSEPJ|nr:hypothetical protein PPERSA_04965 [Pseudocohnilembus persalinus]|eukprot:KRX06352.1 hypothetical protein PPERSA_04965 [Pseudocohnilembus persalinus]
MNQEQIDQAKHPNYTKLRGYDFWKSIGSPQHICAPMVAQSELAFRLLVSRYGTDLCYSPMINSNIWVNRTKKENEYIKQIFKTCPEEKRVVIQIAGHDPNTMLQTANEIASLYPNCVAIDVNYGCPQDIARRGRYGSHLLSSHPDLCVQILETLAKNCSIPVFAKIRIQESEQKTLKLAENILKSGISALAVHGRTKEEKSHKQKGANWEIIKKIKEMANIPVIANGGIYDFQDVQRCFDKTNVDAVMSAEGLLEYPALFSREKKVYDLDDLCREYMVIAKEHFHRANQKEIKSHLFKFFHVSVDVKIEKNKQLVQKLGKANLFDEFEQVCEEFYELRKNLTAEEKRGWYFRWWKAGYTRVNGEIIPNEPVKMHMDKKEYKGQQNQNGNQNQSQSTENGNQKIEQTKEKQEQQNLQQNNKQQIEQQQQQLIEVENVQDEQEQIQQNNMEQQEQNVEQIAQEVNN